MGIGLEDALEDAYEGMREQSWIQKLMKARACICELLRRTFIRKA